MRFCRFVFLGLISLLTANEQYCAPDIRSCQLWIRHTEPKGLGYRSGYTTAEAFLMTPQEYWGFYPYLDLRGHIFDSGRAASNIGVGGRVIRGERIWGANAYYDARWTKRITFNQLAFGFEAIGSFFDFYANGYIVIGRKNSPSYGLGFDHFEDHYLYLKRKTDSAMSGVDANFRFHFLEKRKWDLYLDVGPYYYHGSFGENTIGGKAGLSAIMADLFFAEASTSYDHTFKWIGQGTVGFRFPLGGKVKACPCGKPVMNARLTQIPDHNEIVVVKKNKRISKAIDPATGQPLFFWFVNNQSNSLGSFESPFPFLQQAETASNPRDYIYVFEGNGTTMNMDQGIVLKNYQQLLGSGVPHTVATTLGFITIPQLTPGYPVMTNLNAMGTGVLLAHANTVAGMHIKGTVYGAIQGVGAGSAVIRDNILTDCNTGMGTDLGGIHIVGPGMSGVYFISGNTIFGTTPDMHGIFLEPNGSDICTIHLLSNFVSVPKDGVELKPEGASNVDSFISGNYFYSSGITDRAFFLEGHNTSQHRYTISGNTFEAAKIGLFVQSRDTSISTGSVSGNQFTNADEGFKMEIGGANSTLIASINNNTFGANGSTDFLAKIPMAHSPATICLSLESNTASAFGYEFDNSGVPMTLFNVYPFANNVGPVTISGAPITDNPTCTP